MGKGCLGINDGFVKGQPLTLMDGDGPGKFQGVLLECADDLLFDLLSFFVKRVFDIFPDNRLNRGFFAAATKPFAFPRRTPW